MVRDDNDKMLCVVGTKDKEDVLQSGEPQSSSRLETRCSSRRAALHPEPHWLLLAHGSAAPQYDNATGRAGRLCE